jgi:hypothetical protein
VDPEEDGVERWHDNHCEEARERESEHDCHRLRAVGVYREPAESGTGVYPQETRLLPIIARPPFTERGPAEAKRDHQEAPVCLEEPARIRTRFAASASGLKSK